MKGKVKEIVRGIFKRDKKEEEKLFSMKMFYSLSNESWMPNIISFHANFTTLIPCTKLETTSIGSNSDAVKTERLLPCSENLLCHMLCCNRVSFAIWFMAFIFTIGRIISPSILIDKEQCRNIFATPEHTEICTSQDMNS